MTTPIPSGVSPPAGSPETVKEFSARIAREFFDQPVVCGRLSDWLEERVRAWLKDRENARDEARAESADGA